MEEAALVALGEQEFCYLTTVGRVSGRPHTIEIWFGMVGRTLYMLSDNHGSDWIKNIGRAPAVTVRIGEQTFDGQGRLVTPGDEDAQARAAVLGKYQPHESDDLSGWSQRARPVAVDLVV